MTKLKDNLWCAGWRITKELKGPTIMFNRQKVEEINYLEVRTSELKSNWKMFNGSLSNQGKAIPTSTKN